MDRPRDGYFSRDPDAVELGDTLFSRHHPSDGCDELMLPPDADTRYEIARSLVGSIARVETWAKDDEPGTAIPYAVEEHRYLVREVRPKGTQYAASVLLPMALETLTYQYERFVDDPLCSHNLNLCSDQYGQSTHSMTVHYARRLTEEAEPPFTDPDEQQWWRDAHDEVQQSFYLSESRSRSIHLDDDPQHWRLGLPWQQRNDALVLPKGFLPDGVTAEQVSFEHLTLHQGSAQWNAQRVLTGQSVQRYLTTLDQTVLPDGQAEFAALAGPLELAQMDKTALQAYDVLPPPFDIRAALREIGYVPMPLLFEAPPADSEDNLWSSHFSFVRYKGAEGFYKVCRFNETPSHGITEASYDDYHLAITAVKLPDGCLTQVEYDYHALQALRIIDANENIQEAIYEPSGQPLATSFHGTENGVAAGFHPLSEYVRPEDHRPDTAIDDPQAAVQKAASTLRKDLFCWMGELPVASKDERLFNDWISARLILPSGHVRASARQYLAQNRALTPAEQTLLELIAKVDREPVHTVILSADRYPDDPVPAQIQISKACVDGFGRALQSQQLVEPGEAYAVAADGTLIVEDGKIRQTTAERRWRVSERIEYNNKGLAVRQFRPFFADRAGYVDDQCLRELSYYDQLFYDPLGRAIKLINAKKDFSRETYHPWYHISEDFNDTAESTPERNRS